MRPTPASKARRVPDDAGGSLIEMMVVLVIIAMMAAMVVPNVIGRPDRARVTVAVTNLRAIVGVQALNRTYPTTAQSLSALVERPVSAPVPAN